MLSCILMKIYENIEENKLIRLYQFYHKWYSFLSLIKIYLLPFSFRPSLNCLKLEFYLYSSIEMYFKVLIIYWLNQWLFISFFSNLYAIFYANNHVFVSWIHGHHTLSILLLWIFYSISFSETHNWRKSWFEKILWLRARISWLAHSSCFSFSYSPNHHHGASLVA